MAVIFIMAESKHWQKQLAKLDCNFSNKEGKECVSTLAN